MNKKIMSKDKIPKTDNDIYDELLNFLECKTFSGTELIKNNMNNEQSNNKLMKNLKRIFKIIVLHTFFSIILTSMFWVILFFIYLQTNRGKANKDSDTINNDTILVDSVNHKDLLVNSFMIIESSNNPNAMNGKHHGILQLSPIMIREANRIIGSNKYKLSDRMNKDKSIEIFHLVMERHNPKYDIKRACYIWNPTASENYYNKINKQYKELKKK